jgi:hypothetical protein
MLWGAAMTDLAKAIKAVSGWEIDLSMVPLLKRGVVLTVIWKAYASGLRAGRKEERVKQKAWNRDVY